jgi:hypothetical protein
VTRLCQRCGKAVPPGGVRYAFEFRLYADYDGVADPADEESFDRALAVALRDEEKALDDKVYLEGRAVLCPECREELLEALGLTEEEGPEGEEGPGGPGEGEEPADDGGSDTVH